jgi:IclR family mhp operon transcriptional activator
MASAIAVPVLAGGVAAASLNLMYLRDAIDQAAVVERLLPLLREAAAELGAAVAGLSHAA